MANCLHVNKLVHVLIREPVGSPYQIYSENSSTAAARNLYISRKLYQPKVFENFYYFVLASWGDSKFPEKYLYQIPRTV